jgi:hypothetical protein
MNEAPRLAVGLAAILALAAPGLAATLQLEPRNPGMFGVARGQTAVWNAVLTEPVAAGHPGCRVTLSFVDDKGEVLHDAAGSEVMRTLHLRDNVADALTLRANDVLARGEQRKSIRPVLSDAPDSNICSDCRSLVLTLEVVKSNGVMVMVDAMGPRDPPPPDPHCDPLTR